MNEAVESALRPYVQQAQQARSAADFSRLVSEALDDARVFVFGELTSFGLFTELDERTQDVVRLFAYGVYADYDESRHGALSTGLRQKLRKLSALQLASHSRSVPYAALARALRLDSKAELEDLLIECMYDGLFRGKMDPERAVLDVEEAVSRDVQPQQIDALLKRLTAWSANATRLQAVLQDIQQRSHLAHDEQRQARESHQAVLLSIYDDVKQDVEAALARERLGIQSALNWNGPAGSMIAGIMEPGLSCLPDGDLDDD